MSKHDDSYAKVLYTSIQMYGDSCFVCVWFGLEETKTSNSNNTSKEEKQLFLTRAKKEPKHETYVYTSKRR